MSGLSDAALRHLQSVLDLPDLAHTKYEIVELLGRGGMGAVYLARDRELDRLVALKVVASPATRGDTAERLLREARILAQLEHPGIVPVHDVGQTPDGRVFYAMKLVRGRSLEDHLRDTPGLSQRLQVFERSCDAVAFAHAHGVVHRDLKPENIMVGPFGEVLVMDWGVAKVAGGAEPVDAEREPASPGGPPGTASGTVLGTPGYMAPEQARGQPDRTDQRSDVHALGAVLSFVLTGRAPMDETLPDLGAVPPPLRAIVRKATATDPLQRYQAVTLLARDLERFRAGLSIDAYRETVVDRARRLGHKYRVPLALVLAYVLMRLLLLLLPRT